MRYQIAKPGSYEVVLVGAGTNVEISVNGGPLVLVRLANRDLTTIVLSDNLSLSCVWSFWQAGEFKGATGFAGGKTTIELPGTLSGPTELALSSKGSVSGLPTSKDSGSLSISEMWLTPR